MTAPRPRWLAPVLVLFALAMSAVFAMQAVGRWAFDRGIVGLLEVSGSHDADTFSRIGQRLFESGRYEAAEAFARTALNRAPLHQKSARTLGLSLLAQNEIPAGRRAMAGAGSLGWQDVATQSWLMWDALQRADVSTALLHADAVARRGAMAAGLFKVFAAFGADPAIRDRLLQRMALNPSWRIDFFRYSSAATLPEAEVANGLLRRLAAGPTPPSRAEVVPIVRRLFDLAAYDRAADLSADLLREARPAGDAVNDGSFARAEIYAMQPFERTPFDWQFGESPNTTAVVERADARGGGALYVEASGGRDAMLARKVVQAAPGPRALSFTVRSDTPSALERFRWSLTCLGDGRELIAPTTGLAPATPNNSVRRIAVTIPPGCAFQRLELGAVRTGEERSASAYFDDVALR